MEGKKTSQAQPNVGKDDARGRFQLPRWPPTNPEIGRLVTKSLQSGDWGRYRSEDRAEATRRLAELTGCEHVFLVSSGSGAVELSLTGVGVRPGDKVVVAAYDYPGNLRAIESVGARPVLVDIDPLTASIAPESLLQVAKSGDARGIRAIVVSHLYGQAARMAELKNIAIDRQWSIVEDACQVPGMLISGEAAGSLGQVGTLSFGGSKPLTAGSGGAIVTRDGVVASRLKSRLHRPSEAFPIAPLASTVLLPQLRTLSTDCAARTSAADSITSGLSGIDTIQVLNSLDRDAKTLPSFYKLALLANNGEHRTQLVSQAQADGLPLGEGFRSLHRVNVRRCDRPVSLELSREFGERCLVLDHTALMANEETVDAVCSWFRDSSK